MIRLLGLRLLLGNVVSYVRYKPIVMRLIQANSQDGALDMCKRACTFLCVAYGSHVSQSTLLGIHLFTLGDLSCQLGDLKTGIL